MEESIAAVNPVRLIKTVMLLMAVCGGVHKSLRFMYLDPKGLNLIATGNFL